MSIKVTLNADFSVTVDPEQYNVNNGNETITWVPHGNQSFTFVGLTGLPDPPFSNLTVTSDKITILDSKSVLATFNYVVTVASGGNNYSSGMGGIAGGGGNPNIKNN